MAPAAPLADALFTDVATLRGLIDAVPHPIFVKDEHTRFVVVNQMMCQLMGKSFEELVGKWDYDFVPKEQADVFRGNDLRVLATGEINESEELFSDGAGQLRTIVTRKKRLITSSGARLLVGCITDISDFRQAEALIRHHADHDALTGLPNRRAFYERIEDQLARANRLGGSFAVLLVDLDRFKPVNDAHGHTAGDSVLCEVAGRIGTVIRRGDAVARLGGDEFAVISETRGRAGADWAGKLAQRIISAVRAPIATAGTVIELGASIGIAQFPSDGASAESLLHAADVAMYRAKNEGRGGYRFFEQAMDIEMREKAALEADLRAAIAAGEIRPYYQPLMSLRDNRLLGFEILARWQHPKRGAVSPDIFIPLAERVGLISELTYALLREAGRDAKNWPQHLSLSLNISPLQLANDQLPVELLAVLTEVGFPPGRLEVEITENALVSDLEAAKSVLSSLQNLGIRIALDDFGTGYSSLHHLRELQFDKLKIDRSFVQSMCSDPESAKIVSAILGLASSLGLPTTAEGIEDQEVLRKVIEGGAEYGQGHLFGRALPASEVALLVARAVRPERRAVG
jgi:diguanylate cyclase (GGDEF)-like protein/PAS domain S-box-containing protein